MASAASAPSRASIRVAHAFAVEERTNRTRTAAGARSACASAAGSRPTRLETAARAGARRSSSCHSDPLRSGASAIRSSSSRPNSGDFSTDASARSSSGRHRKSPSATRSCTAICSVSIRRSAPATPMPRAFSAETMTGANGARLRTRIRMSPARIGRPSRRQHLAGCRASRGWSSAMRAASRTTGERRARLGQRRPGLRRRRRLIGLLSRPDLDQARVPGAIGDVRDRLARRGQPRRARRIGEDAVDRRQQRLDRAERQGERHAPPAHARPRGALRRTRCRPRRTWRAPRPGSCRSTASRRRRQTACAARRVAPCPEKNSSASARITCHCTGLVSCASSTRMWSRPPSSL